MTSFEELELLICEDEFLLPAIPDETMDTSRLRAILPQVNGQPVCCKAKEKWFTWPTACDPLSHCRNPTCKIFRCDICCEELKPEDITQFSVCESSDHGYHRECLKTFILKSDFVICPHETCRKVVPGFDGPCPLDGEMYVAVSTAFPENDHQPVIVINYKFSKLHRTAYLLYTPEHLELLLLLQLAWDRRFTFQWGTSLTSGAFGLVWVIPHRTGIIGTNWSLMGPEQDNTAFTAMVASKLAGLGLTLDNIAAISPNPQNDNFAEFPDPPVHRTLSELELPSTWDSSTQSFVVPVQNDTHEFRSILELFPKDFLITSVSRSQNVRRFRMFQMRASLVGANLKHRVMFHLPRAPIDVENGDTLDFRFGDKGCFGKGLYLASNPMKSHTYGRGRKRKMYIVQLCYEEGKVMYYPHSMRCESLRRPPGRYDAYDAVAGYPDGVNEELVLYDNDHHYLAYVVEYEYTPGLTNQPPVLTPTANINANIMTSFYSQLNAGGVNSNISGSLVSPSSLVPTRKRNLSASSVQNKNKRRNSVNNSSILSNGLYNKTGGFNPLDHMQQPNKLPFSSLPGIVGII